MDNLITSTSISLHISVPTWSGTVSRR